MKNLYLDIDGVLLTTKQTKASENSEELIEFIIGHFNCYWLTTHCKGNAEPALKYLGKYFNEPTIEKLKKVMATNWETLKTEAIDFSTDFFWLEDCPFDSEIAVSRDNLVTNHLIVVDLSKPKELLNVIEKLKIYYSLN